MSLLGKATARLYECHVWDLGISNLIIFLLSFYSHESFLKAKPLYNNEYTNFISLTKLTFSSETWKRFQKCQLNDFSVFCLLMVLQTSKIQIWMYSKVGWTDWSGTCVQAWPKDGQILFCKWWMMGYKWIRYMYRLFLRLQW